MNLPRILTENPPEQITRFQASSNYTFLLLHDGKRLISGYTLQFFETWIDTHAFIRIDRSNLVNRSYICGISADGSILLKNKQILQIPRRRKALLQRQYPLLFETQTTL